jgi:hypothetical protein
MAKVKLTVAWRTHKIKPKSQPRYKIMSHTNPLLGNKMLNELSRRQTLDKQSVAKLRNIGRRLRSQVKVTLRLTVSQSVSLGVEPHLGLMTRYLAITIWQLRSCFCGAPSLTRGRVCPLYMLLGIPNAVSLGSESLVLATIFYCLRFETSHFVASYDSQGHGEGILPRLHTGFCIHLETPVTQPVCGPRYITSGRTQQKTPPPTVFTLLLWAIA